MIGEILIGLIGALIGGGGFSWVFYIRETKREKKVATDNEVAEGYRQLAVEKQHRIDALETSLDKKDIKIDELQKEKEQLREDKYALIETLAIERMMRCTEIACSNRKPPFGTIEKLKFFLENEPRIEKPQPVEYSEER